MQLVKLGSKGQVSIPKAILEQARIRKESHMLVELTPDGAIVLRQAAVYPLETFEIYSPERLREFEEADRLSPAERKQLRARKR